MIQTHRKVFPGAIQVISRWGVVNSPRGGRMLAALMAVAVALFVAARSASADSITVSGTYLAVDVEGSSDRSSGTFEVIAPVSPPFVHTHSVIDDLVSSASADYAFDANGFKIATAHARSGAILTYASSSGSIFFTVGANTTYAASGSYTVDDVGVGSRMFLQASLFDLDAGPADYLFNSMQQNQGIYTTDQTFTVGGLDAVGSNLFTGSLTGNLIAGHRYIFDYGFLTDSQNVNQGATAQGNVSLQIGTPAVVPVPRAALGGAVLMVGLGLNKLWGRRRTER